MYVLTYSRLFKKKIVAKVEIVYFFLFLAECNFPTLINYSANMCRTSYEPTVYSDIARKIPNHVTANHKRGGINKKCGGFNNSLYFY